MAEREKPITAKKIPGTEVPDLGASEVHDEQDKKFMSRVAVSTAVFAAFAAISSMFATHHLSFAMDEQIQASDQWNYYQAKGVKYSVLEGRIEIGEALKQTVSKADSDKLEQYKKDQEQIKAEATRHQDLAAKHRAANVTLGRASTAFQIAIALAAVALLLRRGIFWYAALALGLAGAIFAGYGFLHA